MFDDLTPPYRTIVSCVRVVTCGPLSGVYPDDEWPAEVVELRGRRA